MGAACETTAVTPAPTEQPTPTPVEGATSTFSAPRGVIGDPCSFGAVVFDVGPVALCQEAVKLALARLGPTQAPLTSVTFRLDICAPNERCAAPPQNEGWVIFTFAFGPPLMVHVGPAGADLGLDGPLTAEAPQPLPAWLAAEIGQPIGP